LKGFGKRAQALFIAFHDAFEKVRREREGGREGRFVCLFSFFLEIPLKRTPPSLPPSLPFSSSNTTG